MWKLIEYSYKTLKRLIIHSAQLPRQGWGAQFAVMAVNGDDRLLDETLSTKLDKQERIWFIVDLKVDQRHNIKIIFYYLFIRRGN